MQPYNRAPSNAPSKRIFGRAQRLSDASSRGVTLVQSSRLQGHITCVHVPVRVESTYAWSADRLTAISQPPYDWCLV